jgi:hypothetical protein
MINNIFYKLQMKKSRRVKSEEQDSQRIGPLFLSKDQETPCPERHKHDRRSEVVHHLTGKLFPQGHEAKQCSPFCLFQTLVSTYHRSINQMTLTKSGEG